MQAGYRGMKARAAARTEEEQAEHAARQRDRAMENRLGISLASEEVVSATTKIQAGFRGFQARRRTSSLKQSPVSTPPPTTPTILIRELQIS